MKLPDEVLTIISAFAEQSSHAKMDFAHALIASGFVAEIPHGRHEETYAMIADTWNAHSGEEVTPRTIRYWIQAAQAYTDKELRDFRDLTPAQLIEAVKLATIAKVEPAEICQWAVAWEVQTVSAMRANWLPITGEPDRTDPPALSGIIRLFDRLIKPDNPHRTRVLEMIAEIRGWL